METTKPTLTINNQGVQILLNRMESHPEEFSVQPNALARLHEGRWDWLLAQVMRRVEHRHKNTDNYRVELPFLNDREVEALYDKFMSVQGEAFTRRIMSELLKDEKDNDPNSVRYRTQGGFNGMSNDDFNMSLPYPR